MLIYQRVTKKPWFSTSAPSSKRETLIGPFGMLTAPGAVMMLIPSMAQRVQLARFFRVRRAL